MNTETTETRIETAAGPVITNAPWINLIKEGPHKATIGEVEVSENKNGKPYISVECDLGTRIHIHQMYLTEKSFGNTTTQLSKSFGIDLETVRAKAVKEGYTVKRFLDEIKSEAKKISGQQCSLNFKHEEYLGKIQSKVAYVNPYRATEASEDSMAGLLKADYKPKEVELTAPSSLDVAF